MLYIHGISLACDECEVDYTQVELSEMDKVDKHLLLWLEEGGYSIFVKLESLSI